jgi:hypothetical protein
MKTFKIMMIALLAMLTMASCGSDDDDPVINPATRVANSYVCTGAATFKYIPTPMASEDTIDIAANNDGSCNIVYRSNVWGKAKFENVALTVNGEKYVVTGAGKVSMGMHGAAPKDYDAEITGTIENGKGSFSINVPSVMGGTVIVLTQNAEESKE